MKKLFKTILPLALIVTSVACQSNGTPSGENSIPDSADIPSVDDSVENSTENPLVEQVSQKLGTRSKLKTTLLELSEKEVKEIKKTTSNDSQTDSIESEFRSAELLTTTTTEHTSTSTSTVKTDYLGYVNKVFYDVTKTGMAVSGERTKVYENGSKPEGEHGAKDENDAVKKIEDAHKAALDATTFWNDYFNPKNDDYNNFVETYYDAMLGDSAITVRAKAYIEKKNWSKEFSEANSYTFVCTFDFDFQLIDGTLTTDKYTSTDWDVETHEPIEGATATQTTATVDSITYGTPETTRTDTMIDLSAYWTTSVSGSFSTYSKLTDWESGNTIDSTTPNELYAGGTVEINDTAITLIPQTAIDRDTIKILSSSNKSAVDLTEDMMGMGGFVWTAITAGETSTLTIGNDFVTLGTVVVTVVEAQVRKTPIINYDDSTDKILDVGTTSAVINGQEPDGQTIVEVTGTGTFVYAIGLAEWSDKAPFTETDLSSLTFTCWDADPSSSNASLSFDTWRNSGPFVEEGEDCYLYVLITITGTGTTEWQIRDTQMMSRNLSIRVTE